MVVVEEEVEDLLLQPVEEAVAVEDNPDLYLVEEEEVMEDGLHLAEEEGGTDLEEVEVDLLTSWEEVEVGSQEEAPCHCTGVEEAESLRVEQGK